MQWLGFQGHLSDGLILPTLNSIPLQEPQELHVIKPEGAFNLQIKNALVKYVGTYVWAKSLSFIRDLGQDSVA